HGGFGGVSAAAKFLVDAICNFDDSVRVRWPDKAALADLRPVESKYHLKTVYPGIAFLRTLDSRQPLRVHLLPVLGTYSIVLAETLSLCLQAQLKGWSDDIQAIPSFGFMVFV